MAIAIIIIVILLMIIAVNFVAERDAREMIKAAYGIDEDPVPQDIQEEFMACLFVVKQLETIYKRIKNDSLFSSSTSHWVWEQSAEIKAILEYKKRFIPYAFAELTKEILSKFKTYTSGAELDFFDDEKFYKYLMMLTGIHLGSIKGRLSEIPPKKRAEISAYIKKQEKIISDLNR